MAVLASAIAAGSGAFNSDTSAVKAKAQATAILEYAEQVKMAVERVLEHGCTDTQISFENPIVSGYTNPNAPSDKSCHVFDVNGGGIVWKGPPAGAQSSVDYNAASLGIKPPLGSYSMGATCVMGVGSGGYGINAVTNPCSYDDPLPGSDLVLVLPWVPLDVCLQINSISGFKNKNTITPPINGSFDFMDNYFFTGNYAVGWGGVALDTTYGNPNNLGNMQGCMTTAKATAWPGGGYSYFRVLLAR